MPSASPDTLRAVASSRMKRIVIRLVMAAIVLVALWWTLLALINIRTSVLWFRSVHAGDVYGTILWSEILLFVVFGAITAAAVAGSLVWLIRHRPPFRPDPQRNRWRSRYLRLEKRFRAWIILVVAAYLGVRIGTRAAQHWQTYLLWRHAQPWGEQDPHFHRDISYYVAVLPFHQLLVSLLSSILVTCLVVSLIASYLYGAIRIRGRGRKLTPEFKSQLSLLVGLWLLVKAAGFWISRYALTTSPRGLVTGLGYTDVHATLPGRTILAVVALLAGLLVLANIWLKRLRFLVLGVAAVVVASLVFGLAWPALVYRFREQPSAASLDQPEIVNNQAATLSAFGLDGVITTEEYGESTGTSTSRRRPPSSARPRCGCSTPTSCRRPTTSSRPSSPSTSSSRRSTWGPTRSARAARTSASRPASSTSRASRAARGSTGTSSTPTGTAWWRRRPTRSTPRARRPSSTVACLRRTRSRSTNRASTSARTPPGTRSSGSPPAAPSRSSSTTRTRAAASAAPVRRTTVGAGSRSARGWTGWSTRSSSATPTSSSPRASTAGPSC